MASEQALTDTYRRLVRTRDLEHLGRRLLELIGEDPDRPGIADTPRRWAAWWTEFVDHDPGQTATVFDGEAISSDDLVVVSGMQVWSLCEHHLLPFGCAVSVGYLPNGKVLGLSKFGRIAHQAAHRLQLQERLVRDIADAVTVRTHNEHVAVVARGEHLCMSMRGVRTPATMTSSVMRGRFRDSPALRAEFLSLAR